MGGSDCSGYSRTTSTPFSTRPRRPAASSVIVARESPNATEYWVPVAALTAQAYGVARPRASGCRSRATRGSGGGRRPVGRLGVCRQRLLDLLEDGVLFLA